VFIIVFPFMVNHAFGVEKANECDVKALKLYSEYRSNLLAGYFEPDKILSLLESGYESQISEGKFYRHFMSYRINEVKISKLLGYHANCDTERINLKLKTENFDHEYSRRSMVWRLRNKGPIVIDASDNKASKKFDSGIIYKTIPSGIESLSEPDK
jgi:hypothetical protein